ncbi:hypothetical protein ACNKHR_06095 [Shigella flexneri]
MARKVLERARACRKPVVVCFLGCVERRWMSRGGSLPAAARGGAKSGDALRRETGKSRPAYA